MGGFGNGWMKQYESKGTPKHVFCIFYFLYLNNALFILTHFSCRPIFPSPFRKFSYLTRF